MISLDKQIKFIASFMILLVISFPFYISSVYAIDISNVKVYGNDGVEGYTKTDDDTVNVEVTLSKPIDTTEIFITSNVLGISENIFNSCDDKICIFDYPINNKDSKEYSLEINVNTADGESASKTQKFCADGSAPTVVIKSVSQIGKELIVKFSASDKAPTNCAPTMLNDATLFINNEIVGDITFDGDKSTEEKYFTITQDQLGNEADETSDKQICIETTDKLGNAGKSCWENSVKLDFSAPDILEDTLVVTDMDDNPIGYVAGLKEDEDKDITTKIKIKINISEDQLIQSKTAGDFSTLTIKGSLKKKYENMKPECTKDKTQNVYECVWSGIELDSKVAVFNVKFTAVDNANNKDSYEATLPIKRVTDNPLLNNIWIVGKEDEVPIYLSGASGKNSYDIIVQISDLVGFNNNKNLRLELFGLTGQTTLENNCIETTKGVWECPFNNTKPNSGAEKGGISVQSDSENDIGKFIDLGTDKDILVKEVIIDSTPPSIAKVFNPVQSEVVIDGKTVEKPVEYGGSILIPGKDAVAESTDCPTYEDSYDLTIFASDNNPLSVIADTSPISNNDITTGQCTETDFQDYDFLEWGSGGSGKKAFECTLSVSNIIPIDLGKTNKQEFTINITDASGNTKSIKHSVGLCTSDYNQKPDVIKSIYVDESQTPIPSLHKKTLQNTDIPIILKLNYEFKNTDVTVLSQDISCNRASVEFLDSEKVVSGSKKEISKTIVFTMTKQTATTDDPNVEWDESGEITDTSNLIKCTATMSVMHRNMIYSQVEQEEFELTVPLEGVIMGEATDTMKNAIKSLNDQIADETSMWDNIEKVITALEILCNIAEFLGEINTILQTAKSVLYGISLVIESIYTGSGTSLWTAVCYPMDKIHYYISKYIWPSGSLPIPWKPGFIFKYICMYLNCTLFRPETWAAVAAEAGEIGLRAAAMEMTDGIDKKAYENAQAEANAANKAVNDARNKNNNQVPQELVNKANAANEKLDKMTYGSKNPRNYFDQEGTVQPADRPVKDDKGNVVKNQDGTTRMETPHPLALSDTGVTGKETLDMIRAPWSAWNVRDDESDSLLSIDSDSLQEEMEAQKQSGYKTEWLNFNIKKMEKAVKDDWASGEMIDPFRVEYFAWFCPRATLYNTQKRKQIICAQKMCHLQSIKYGMSPAACDKARDIHWCLYVDSAYYHLLGGGGGLSAAWGEVFLDTLLSQLAEMAITYLAIGLVGCWPYFSPSGSASTTYCSSLQGQGWRSSLCGLGMAALGIAELQELVSGIGDKFSGMFSGGEDFEADYCTKASELESQVIL
ncbi:MAG: hypothetical protein ABIG89_07210 [Candidatus Woesearchaeota archaeon]